MVMGNMLRDRDVQYVASKDETTHTWRILNTWSDLPISLSMSLKPIWSDMIVLISFSMIACCFSISPRRLLKSLVESQSSVASNTSTLSIAIVLLFTVESSWAMYHISPKAWATMIPITAMGNLMLAIFIHSFSFLSSHIYNTFLHSSLHEVLHHTDT